MADRWRDSYDAWKTREPDHFRSTPACMRCGSEDETFHSGIGHCRDIWLCGPCWDDEEVDYPDAD